MPSQIFMKSVLVVYSERLDQSYFAHGTCGS